jgi:clorobiocin/coumermycin A biosynthesis protein CloN6/CouN6
MDQQQTPNLSADLFLLHAPSVYDFRERDDMLFAYLSDSDSVNVTSVYEMYPIGWLSIKQRLADHGLETKIVNIASLMLMYPELDVRRLLGRLEAPVFGFDLHWMTQCHGAIRLAALLKEVHPEALTIFGGISATYYASQLIAYPSVDVVVQGYDTLDPVTELVGRVRRGSRDFRSIPNLLYKVGDEALTTGFTHKPAANYNNARNDWSYYRDTHGAGPTVSKLIMTLPNTGCAHDCGWCGGSKFAYRNIMGVRKTLIQKDHDLIVDELRTMRGAAQRTSIYALQCYSENKTRLHQYLDAVKEVGYNSVSFEQFNLTPLDTLRKMGGSTDAYIMLSPESHDPKISAAAGRGTYTMAEMEDWIPRALDAGVKGIMVWFFIGMPYQDRQSVLDTVAYSERLIQKFGGWGALPLICPMVPFLDPGCRFFQEPAQHGYRIFHRTLEEHRQAMVEPLWHRRLNYETRWLDRRQLQDVSYEAIARLVEIKGEYGVLPSAFCQAILATIEETRRLLAELERALLLDGTLPATLRHEVRSYNRKILAYSSDQIIPVKRPFGGRWFDDTTVPRQLIEDSRLVTRLLSVIKEGFCMALSVSLPSPVGYSDVPSPFSMDGQAFRDLGHRLVDTLGAYLDRLPENPVYQPLPVEVRRQIEEMRLPAEGIAPEEILEFFAQRVLPYGRGQNHPCFAAFVDPAASKLSMLAAFASAVTNTSGAGGEYAAIYLEQLAVRWLMELIGFPGDSSDGVLLGGGSDANRHCMEVARHWGARVGGWDVREDGLQGHPRLTMYMSAEGHSCLDKAAFTLGLGSPRKVAVDHEFRMDLGDLRAAVAADRGAGHRPFLVAANAGSVKTGAIDPLGDLADFCHREGLWLHVDGAYGGFGALDPRLAHWYAGLERADSVAIDPHKWLAVAIGCSCAIVRHGALLQDTYKLVPSYLSLTPGKGFAGHIWYSHRSAEQTRDSGRALKTFWNIQQAGRAGLVSHVSRHIDLARYMEKVIEASPDMELLATGPLTAVCFRYVPADWRGGDEGLDQLNQAVMEDVQAGGKAFLAGTDIRGRFALRSCALHYDLGEDHVEAIVGAVRSAGSRRAQDRQCAG